MEELWNVSDKAGGLHIFSETIQCGDKKYISIHEASKDLKLSGERVRQKIKSEKYKDWIYLDNWNIIRILVNINKNKSTWKKYYY